jgi:hypothetical protein
LRHSRADTTPALADCAHTLPASELLCALYKIQARPYDQASASPVPVPVPTTGSTCALVLPFIPLLHTSLFSLDFMQFPLLPILCSPVLAPSTGRARRLRQNSAPTSASCAACLLPMPPLPWLYVGAYAVPRDGTLHTRHLGSKRMRSAPMEANPSTLPSSLCRLVPSLFALSIVHCRARCAPLPIDWGSPWSLSLSPSISSHFYLLAHTPRLDLLRTSRIPLPTVISKHDTM